MQQRFSLFTKPWKYAIPDLAMHVSSLGFDEVELPVRDGYPVNPDNAATELNRAGGVFADFGLKIASVAGPTDERMIAACAVAAVPVIRICVGTRSDELYLEGIDRLHREFDALVPVLERYGVTLGCQNHYGDHDVVNAMGLRRLVERFDRRQIAAVWDAGHNGLQGEAPAPAIDIVWSHLCMVNLKSAYWLRTNGPEAPHAEWSAYWTTGRHGRADWRAVARELIRRQYRGPVCLTAEYSDELAVNRLIAEDIAFARSLWMEMES